jgi:hypothetical protein
MKKTLYFLAIMVYAMLLADSAYACSCGRGTTPKQYFKSSSFVFIGEFQKANFYKGGPIKVLFTVREALKGNINSEDSVTVQTGPICETDWRGESRGALWIIYASQVATNTVPPATILATSICSGTSPIKAAKKHLKYFDSLK